MSIKTKVSFGVLLFGLFMIFGTAGAIDTNSISLAQFIVRLAWIIPMITVAVHFFRMGVKEDGDESY